MVEVRALAIRAAGRGLPLELGRQSLPGPAGERVRLRANRRGRRAASGSSSFGAAHRGSDPAPLAVALPVARRLGARIGDVLREGSVGDRRAVDLERLQHDRVPRALVVVGEPVRPAAPISCSPPSTATISGPSPTLARVDRLGLRRARSSRPSAAAAASSRCAGARGRSASRRGSRREGARPRPRGRLRRAPRACARGPPHVGAQLVAAQDRRAGCGSSAGSRSRRRGGPARRASARARPPAAPATAPRSWRYGPGPS